MAKQTVIQSVTVISSIPSIFCVGAEHNDRAIIEIKQVGYDSVSEFHVLDEDGELIVSIENAPVIVEWKTIVVDDVFETNKFPIAEDLPF
ncbi:MAG: hypothetical protein ACQEXQ_16165 [Bacillota bacterium]